MKARLASVVLALLGCASAVAAPPLNVAVAANLQHAFTEIAQAFAQAGATELRPVYGSSGKLYAQVAQGAPLHVFLSADMQYPERLVSAGLTLGTARPYAIGRLVAWTLGDFDLGDLPAALRDPRVRHVAVANPQTAPYGREALRAIAAMGLTELLTPKLVYGESIGQTNQFITTRAADLGITARSSVLAPPTRALGRWVELPADSHAPILQGVVLLRTAAAQQARAQAFLDFLLGDEARLILARHGYDLP